MSTASPQRSVQIDQTMYTVVEFVMYLIHTSIIIFIFFRRRTIYQNPFYYIMFAICVIDLLYFVIITMLVIRGAYYGPLTPIYEKLTWIASTGFCLSNVFGYGQFFGQLLISINRFTIFWFPVEHKKIWSKSWYWFIIIFLPIICVSYRFGAEGKFDATGTNIVIGYVDQDLEHLSLRISTFINGGAASVTAIFTALALLKYYLLKRNHQIIHVPNLEVRMLVFSLIVFFIQFLRFLYALLRYMFLPYPKVLTILMYVLPFISDFLAWVCSFSLVFVSPASRRAYFEFYFGNVVLKTPKIFASVALSMTNRVT